MAEDAKHIPVIIANFAPFRLVVRPHDKWNPSIDDINNRTYDYVKLCRISTFLDIGIAPFSLGVGFDGSLVLPALPEFQGRDVAVEKFNEVLGILLVGGLYVEAVAPSDISQGAMTLDCYTKMYGGGTGANASLHGSIRTKHVGTLDVISLLAPQQTSIAELEAAYSQGKLLFNHFRALSPVLLLNGTSAFAAREWTNSLINLWTGIEQVINMIWKERVLDVDSPLVDGRLAFLKDFRTWTIAAKIELLYQKNCIDIETYRILSKARKARNDIVHTGGGAKSEGASNALDALLRVMSLASTEYKDFARLSTLNETLRKHQRGELMPKRATLETNEVTHWLARPPLPGDSDWGEKPYEIITELVLKPLKNGT